MKIIFVAVAILVVVIILVLAVRRRAGDDEQILREAYESGAINHMPDDPEAFMEEVEAATRLAEEWAARMERSEGAVGNDGWPVYSQLYPNAIEHFVRANRAELGADDRLDVAKAAKHFESYWRARGEFPKDEDGNPHWFVIYGQIQEHFRQWVNGRVER